MKYTEQNIIYAINMYQNGAPLKEIKNKIAPERNLATFETELGQWRKKLGIGVRDKRLRGWFDWNKIKQGVGVENPK